MTWWYNTLLMPRISKIVKTGSKVAVCAASARGANWLGEKIVDGYFYPNDSLEPLARFAGGYLLPFVVVCMEVAIFDSFRSHSTQYGDSGQTEQKVIDLNQQSMLRRGTPLYTEENNQDLA